jgi:hypothetical protein
MYATMDLRAENQSWQVVTKVALPPFQARLLFWLVNI